MASSTSPESSSKPSGAAASCSSSDTGDTELTMVNLAALQEDIHRMENPNFDVQKQTVRELFDRGIPFFTRPAMEQLKGQIDAIKSMVMKGESTDGQKFVVLSITGQTVERAVLKGLAQSRQLGNETVLLEPCLMYATYQALVNHKYSDQALCPLQICYGGHNEQDHLSSFEDTRGAFDASVRAWQASGDCAKLKSSLAAVPLPGITKIIAFACSSISRDVDHARIRSATQHALMLTLRDIVQSSQPGVEIKCLAQDPVYTEIDKVILLEAGITTVDDPEGFLGVDDQSVVLSFSPNIPVRQIITDLARPVMLAWDTVLTEEQTISRWATAHEPPKTGASAEELEACLCDPESSRVRAMIKGEYFQVQKLENKGFGDASIYIRNYERGR